MLLSADDLWQQPQRIQIMLRPISRATSGPACQGQTVAGVWVVGTHDGSPPQSSYRDWRFATLADRHHAMYFEAWRPVSKRQYSIQHAALNIYSRDSEGREAEILCLHCEPSQPETSPHGAYRRGPHLHLSFLGDPLKKSHLALHVGRVHEVLASCDHLHQALRHAVQMIGDEVITVLSTP